MVAVEATAVAVESEQVITAVEIVILFLKQ
jgi:hypothetical protein